MARSQARTTENPRDWIGVKPSGRQLSAVLLIGTMGMVICGVQPVLLGSLVLENRLSSAALGWTITAEFASLALGIWLAGNFFNPTQMRLRIAVAAILAIVADCLVAGAHGNQVLLNRTLAGLPEGVLVWLTACMIARCPTPARMSGIFLTLQNVSQFAFAAILPPTLMHLYGADGGFIGLGFTAALALLATPFIPNSFVELPSAPGHSGKPTYSGNVIACLICVFLISAYSIGMLAYIEPLGSQAHLSEDMVRYTNSGVLFGCTLGSLLAAAVPRTPHYAVFFVCMLINTAVAGVLASMPGPLPFFGAAVIFGFFWLFFLPFQLPMAIEADPTRQVTVVLPGVQLIGAAAGPLLSSFFVTNQDARGALLACWLCFLIAFAISTVQHVRLRRTNRLQPRGIPT